MKGFKRVAALGVAIGILLGAAWGGRREAHATDTEGKLSIIATVFPAYDFMKAIAGEGAQVHLLLPPGTESHSYEPTPQDILSIQKADLFLYVGGESEYWVEAILASLGEDVPPSLSMMECVALLEEEESPSMEPDSHPEEEGELDEHVWTSPKNAMLIAQQYVKTLCSLDEANASVYQANGEEYIGQLKSLDEAFQGAVDGGVRKKIIFGDRFPFRYLAAAYGLQYDAAFPGCSEDAEPSVRTLVSLVREIKEADIPVVFYIELSSQKTANILAEETGAKTMLLHSCHNLSLEEMERGETYLSLMGNNVDALKEALVQWR